MAKPAQPEAAIEPIVTLTPQEQLIALIGKRVTIEDSVHKAFAVVLQYVGESDIITKEGVHYPFWQVAGEAKDEAE